MVEWVRYKWPIIGIVSITTVLLIMIAVGFSIGFLSEDPDGLERVIIDAKGEEYLEGLPQAWNPLLGWLESDYFAGIIGIVLSVVVMVSVFYLVVYLKKRKANKL